MLLNNYELRIGKGVQFPLSPLASLIVNLNQVVQRWMGNKPGLQMGVHRFAARRNNFQEGDFAFNKILYGNFVRRVHYAA